MNKFISSSLIWLLMLTSSIGFGQSFTITLPDSLAGKKYVENYVKQALKGLTGTPVTPTDPVVVNPAGCKEGPEIKTISEISTTGLKFTFHGEDVFKMDAEIYSETGAQVYKKTIEPTGPANAANFNLPSGKYRLVLRGVSCFGTSAGVYFTIPDKSTGGGVDIGTPPDPGAGWNAKTVTSGMPWHMNLKLTGNAQGLTITDEATPSVGSNYDLTYLVGGQILRGVSPLKNFAIRPGQTLRVLKYKIKKGVSSLDHWASAPSDTADKNTYYSYDAAELFSSNTSVAFQTIVFPSNGTTDESGFLRWVDNRYNPALQTAQWGDIGDNITLPKGHVFIARKSEWSIDQIRAKGVTHISNYDLPWNTDINEVTRLKRLGITYNDVPRPEAFMHLNPVGEDKWVNGYNLRYWPNGPLSDEEAIRKANEADISDAMWIGETLEGNSFMPQDARMWAVFYKRLRERYEEAFGSKGIPYLIAHNYFQFWSQGLSFMNLGNLPKDEHKRIVALPADQMPKNLFSPNGNLSSTNLIVDGIYLNAPDIQAGSVYQTIYRMLAIKAMGYNAGVFLAGNHEWRPNNFNKYIYPDGVFYSAEKIPLDPSVVVAYSFTAQVFGKLYLEWGAAGKQSTRDFNRYNFKMGWSNGSWFTNGQTDDRGFNNFPHVTDSNDYYAGFGGSSDFSYFGQELFCNSYGKVEGGTDKYLKFRIDGGAWIQPENSKANDIVEAWYGQRGFVHSRTLNGKTAWFYLNSFADNAAHTLEVEMVDGSIVKETVSGNGIHVKIR